jgi:phosphate:Na+ symporter
VQARQQAVEEDESGLVLAVGLTGALDPLARLLVKVFPAKKKTADPAAPRYLDESLIELPSLALADAARETLRMGDFVEVMLWQIMVALMNNDRALVTEVSRMDNTVDKLDKEIKLYVTKLTRGSLDEREGRRTMEIISFAINLEHIGDIIDKNPRLRPRSCAASCNSQRPALPS